MESIPCDRCEGPVYAHREGKMPDETTCARCEEDLEARAEQDKKIESLETRVTQLEEKIERQRHLIDGLMSQR